MAVSRDIVVYARGELVLLLLFLWSAGAAFFYLGRGNGGGDFGGGEVFGVFFFWASVFFKLYLLKKNIICVDK